MYFVEAITIRLKVCSFSLGEEDKYDLKPVILYRCIDVMSQMASQIFHHIKQNGYSLTFHENCSNSELSISRGHFNDSKHNGHIIFCPCEILGDVVISPSDLYYDFASVDLIAISCYKGAAVEVWEWIINSIPKVMMDVIIYPCWYPSFSMLVKRAPSNEQWKHINTFCVFAAIENRLFYFIMNFICECAR